KNIFFKIYFVNKKNFIFILYKKQKYNLKNKKTRSRFWFCATSHKLFLNQNSLRDKIKKLHRGLPGVVPPQTSFCERSR
ncbi:MAG TPA: hypothetical protein PK886_02125, partial [Candidatus Paceibacterota bacterium]|nr:hypothetical protein [Candidatus Paceibacterota bacterium]